VAKQKICFTFASGRQCKFGAQCRYLHQVKEKKVVQRELCESFMKGYRRCECKFPCLTEPYLRTPYQDKWILKRPIKIYSVRDSGYTSCDYIRKYETQDGKMFLETKTFHEKEYSVQTLPDLIRSFVSYEHQSTYTPDAFWIMIHKLSKRRQVLDYLELKTKLPHDILLLIVDEFSDVRLTSTAYEIVVWGH
jgi:hypothetical protein